MLLEIPPKISISSFMGFLKEKISLTIYVLNSNIGTENFGIENIM